MRPLGLRDDFLWWLGSFHGLWATTEVVTCYAIGKLLKVSDLEAHILTAGMEFGRKATLLRNLAYHSPIPNQEKFFKSINALRDQSKRNIIAHGFVISDEHTVTFIDRSRGGDYSATPHTFTMEEFKEHVEALLDAGTMLAEALDLSSERLDEFAKAAFNTENKSSKSPEPPLSKA